MSKKPNSNIDAFILLILLLSITIPFIAWQEPDTLPEAIVPFARYALPPIGLAAALAAVLLLHKQDRWTKSAEEIAAEPAWKKRAYVIFIAVWGVVYLIRVAIRLTGPGGPLS